MVDKLEEPVQYQLSLFNVSYRAEISTLFSYFQVHLKKNYSFITIEAANAPEYAVNISNFHYATSGYISLHVVSPDDSVVARSGSVYQVMLQNTQLFSSKIDGYV